MNKLEALSLKARAAVPKGVLDPDKWIKEYNKNFAELIVRECIAICKDIDGEEDAMAKCSRQDCAVEIREHFGVEE
jgi:hypothetical protein